MSGNTFGKLFKLTTFGESHGEAIGGIIDGCPAGIHIDFEAIKNRNATKKTWTIVQLLLNEKKKMKYNFYQEFLKEKLQEHQLVL